MIWYITNVDTEILALRTAIEALPDGFPRVRAGQPWTFDLGDLNTPIDGVTSDLIAAVMRSLGRPAVWQGARPALVDAIAGDTRAGDLVITMGAGEVTRCGAALLSALAGVTR